MNMRGASRYTSKASGRVASQELLRRGSNIAVIKSSRAWLGSGFGSYIDLEFDREEKISKIPTVKIGDDSYSEDDIEKPTLKRAGKSKKKKV